MKAAWFSELKKVKCDIFYFAQIYRKIFWIGEKFDLEN